MKSIRKILIASIFLGALLGCSDIQQVDTPIKSGLVYDGTYTGVLAGQVLRKRQ